MLGTWLRLIDDDKGVSPFQFERAELSKHVGDSIRDTRQTIVYGLPRQGKSAIVKLALRDQPHVLLHASRSLDFEDIARNYLMTIGCSVLVERKKKYRAGAKAEVKFAWPIFSAGGAGEMGAEAERTEKSFSADIGNPNDVSYLIKQFRAPSILVIDRFEQLSKSCRASVLEFARISCEDASLKVVMICSAVDVPLDFSEKIQFLPYLTLVHVPALSKEEVSRFIEQAVKPSGNPQAAWSDAVYEAFRGSLGLTLDACKLLAQKQLETASPAKPARKPVDVAGLLEEEFRSHLITYYLALLSAIIDEGWGIDCEVIPEQKKGGKGETSGQYVYVQRVEPNFGIAACEIISTADLSGDVEITEERLADYAASRKLRLREQGRQDKTSRNTRRLGKKLLRLQKKLLIEPPIIAVNDGRTRILLWSKANASLAERIKSGVQGILDSQVDLD